MLPARISRAMRSSWRIASATTVNVEISAATVLNREPSEMNIRHGQYPLIPDIRVKCHAVLRLQHIPVPLDAINMFHWDTLEGLNALLMSLDPVGNFP